MAGVAEPQDEKRKPPKARERRVDRDKVTVVRHPQREGGVCPTCFSVLSLTGECAYCD
ncbi:hypothetical protein [Microbacterium rhizophilus]|uniref:hypothetical protein n=1 Tax=Microbacterium rhizophilus TaxID=3138934 RepID=UPI0031ECDEAC